MNLCGYIIITQVIIELVQVCDTEAWTRALVVEMVKVIRFGTYFECRVSAELLFTIMERMVVRGGSIL